MQTLKKNATYRLDTLAQLFFATVLLILCSKARFYVLAVPFTLQTFGVILISLIYAKNVALTSVAGMLCYLISSATTSVTSPTIGYIAGLFCAVILVDCLKKTKTHTALISCLASCIVLFIGTLYLAFYMRSIQHALAVGLVPFFLKDTVLAIFAYYIAKFIKPKF